MAQQWEVLNGPHIAAGESLSDVLDCSTGELVRITMPPDWTEAKLTFQISTDGEFFNDLFDMNGYEVTLHVVPGAAALIPVDVARAIVFLRIRSGLRADPVPQAADRLFAVAVKIDHPGSGSEVALPQPSLPPA